MSDPFNVIGSDGISRSLAEHYDGQKDVEQDPYGAWLAIQNLSNRPATDEQVMANEKVQALVEALEETQNDASFFQQSGVSQTAMSAAFDRIHNRAATALAALEVRK